MDDEGEVYMLEGEYYRTVSEYRIYANDPVGNGISGVDFFCEVCYTTQISQYSDPFNCTARLEGATNSSGALTLILLRKAYFGDEEPPEPSGGVLSTENLAQQGVGVLIIDEPGGQEQAAGWPQYNLVSQQVYLENLPINYVMILEPTSTYSLNSLETVTYVAGSDLDNNDIFDEYEMELAKKFCPTLIPSSSTEWIAPEPVDIMSHSGDLDRHDIFASIYDLAQTSLGSYPIDDIRPCANMPNEPINQFGYHPSDPPLMGTLANYSNWDIHQERGGPHFDLDSDGFYETWQPTGIFNMILHFEYGSVDNNNGTAWSNEYQNERLNNNFKHTIYAHLFKKDEAFVLQYWFFYPYNDFTNDHEGDWEHINVIVSDQDPEVAEIVEIDYYFHNNVKTMQNGFTLDGGTHPRVYIGGWGSQQSYGSGPVSGGSYPCTGTWIDIGPFSADEQVYGQGPWITYFDLIGNCVFENRGIVLLRDPNYYDFNQEPYFSWLKMNIYWGHLPPNDGNWYPYGEPPVGPYFSKDDEAWKGTGTCEGEFNEYTDIP